MANYASRFDNLLVPVLLARKGKGHRAVTGKFSVGTSGYIAPEMLMRPILTLANTTISSSVLASVAQQIAQEFKVGVVEVGCEFDLPQERLSIVDFTDAVTTFTAGLQSTYSRKRVKSMMWLSMPVVVQEVLLVLGNLTVVLGTEEKLYFEDILFNIEKVVQPVKPAFTDEERMELLKHFEGAKSAYTILSTLLDFFTGDAYITSVDLELKYTGVVLKTDMRHTIGWKRR
jgi:hypothetical protein